MINRNIHSIMPGLLLPVWPLWWYLAGSPAPIDTFFSTLFSFFGALFWVVFAHLDGRDVNWGVLFTMPALLPALAWGVLSGWIPWILGSMGLVALVTFLRMPRLASNPQVVSNLRLKLVDVSEVWQERASVLSNGNISVKCGPLTATVVEPVLELTIKEQREIHQAVQIARSNILNRRLGFLVLPEEINS